MKGSPFISKAQVINGGSTSNENVIVESSDNFHRILSIESAHLPGVTDNKKCGENDPKPCRLNIYTVSQAVYALLTPFDTGN